MKSKSEEDLSALKDLEWATQALAMESEIQLTLFPDFADKAFELLDDYDNWYNATKFRENLPISKIQAKALSDINELIVKLPNNLVCEESMKNDKAWVELRNLARKGLEILGWPFEPPPANRGTYIQ
jgi:hypothetical protein